MPLNKYKFAIKRNDTLPNLIVKVVDRGDLFQKQGFDLSSVTAVTFSMMNQDCDIIKIADKPALILCTSGGTIQYSWETGDTDESGDYSGEFQLYFSGGGKLSLPSIGGIEIKIFDNIG